MKDANWEDCLNNSNSRKITPDNARAQSLTETAKERLNLITDINEKNCNFVFEDCYTSLLELLQAYVFRKGYNVLNHICLGYYIRDILKREDLFRIFDDLRYKRNSLTYYGRRIDSDTAKVSIQRCREMIADVIKIIEKL